MKALKISALALAFVVGQGVVPMVTADFGTDAGAAFAKSEKSKGGSKSKKPARKDRVKTTGKPEHAGRKQGAAVRSTTMKPAAATKPKNVHAQLKGLNSLNRNINGLMNSSDPKMAPFRALVVVGAEADAALATLQDAQTGLDTSNAELATLLETLGLDAPADDGDTDALASDLQAIASAPQPVAADFQDESGILDQAAYDAALDDWATSTSTAQAAIMKLEETKTAAEDLTTAQSEYDALQSALDEDALRVAISDAMNTTGGGPLAPEDVSPEMLAWISEKLGIGDTEGLIDDYILMAPDQDALLDVDTLDPSLDSELVEGEATSG